MHFDSLIDAFDMQGHGVFVWSAYAIALLVLLSLVIKPWLKNKRFFVQQAMILRREQSDKTSDSVP